MPNAAGLSLGRRYWSNAVFLLESGAGGTAEAEEGEAPGEGAKEGFGYPQLSRMGPLGCCLRFALGCKFRILATQFFNLIK